MSWHKKSRLEADLKCHRMSNFQTMGRKFVKLGSGYDGQLSFMDGAPSMFCRHFQTDGLFNLQEYLRISYGSKERDGGVEGLDTGNPVLAKYSVDRLYCRARIQEVMFKEEDKLQVHVLIRSVFISWFMSYLGCVLLPGGCTLAVEGGRWRYLDSRSAGGFPEDHAAGRTHGATLEGTKILEKKSLKFWCGDLEDWKQSVDLPLAELDISKLKIQPTEPVLNC